MIPAHFAQTDELLSDAQGNLMKQNKQYPFAFLAGICATLTLPPLYLFPLAVPAYGGLYFLLHHAETQKRAASIGFFWGWGFFMSGLYWFVIALMTDPEKFAWLIPFALFALTAIIALYTALFAWLYHHVKCDGFSGALVFAALWTAVEFARGHLFSGFPWNLGGYAFAASDASIQLASVLGIYGLTFLTVLLGVLSLQRRALPFVLGLLVAIFSWGQWRVQSAPQEFAEGVNLRLVQPNIQQHHKWNPALQMQGLRTSVALMQSPGIEEVTHVIWPETAVPYVLGDHSTLAKRLGETLLPEQYLITGAMRGNDIEHITNSIAMIDDKGEVVGSYDKHKLVPFGEFLPLRSLIPAALETPVGMTDLARGEGVRTLRWPGLPPLSALICYEVIFPALAVNKDDRPAWLLSVTNDAWFGTSSAPYQHLAMARMRAVEQGLPMVRVANTGISAVYDAYGREVVRIPLNEKTFIDTRLPLPSQNRTIYSRWIL
jgi:apolipoprotein N-acyltransferase